jgi:hypothetical protein
VCAMASEWDKRLAAAKLAAMSIEQKLGIARAQGGDLYLIAQLERAVKEVQAALEESQVRTLVWAKRARPSA